VARYDVPATWRLIALAHPAASRVRRALSRVLPARKG
jgi:hypothetical protein